MNTLLFCLFAAVLSDAKLTTSVERFNAEDEELYTNAIPNAAALAEDLDRLYAAEKHREAARLYPKAFRFARVLGHDLETATDDALVRRYLFAVRMQKFAARYQYVCDPPEILRERDLVVAEYAARHPGAVKCPEANLAAAAAQLAGLCLAPVTRQPPIAIIPKPVSLTERPGTYTTLSLDVTHRLAACEIDSSLPKEGYVLTVAPDGITIRSATPQGRSHAVATLRQLAVRDKAHEELMTFPCVEIADSPRFPWRGAHLDESRHFFGKAVVKRFIQTIADYKFNIFHWHLTDNLGWRLPVLKRPDLAPTCSTRKASDAPADIWDTIEDTTYGPFYYTEKDIREIVAFAKECQVEILPEIDVPGHSIAVLKTHPELGCEGKGGEVFCIGNPETLRFFDDVFDSVVAFFPGEFVHIGCDEVDKTAWKKCPKCQAFMKAHDLKDENALQGWVIGYLAKRLAAQGKRIVGWDELAMESEIPAGGVIMEWRDGYHGGAAAVKKGHACVKTPWATSYFNGRQKIANDPMHYAGPQWYGPALSLKEAYAYDPLGDIPEEGKKLVLGGQCCNWTEQIATELELQWKMWPRAMATAEIYWSPATTRNYADFERRVRVQRPRLIDNHVNCAPLE